MPLLLDYLDCPLLNAANFAYKVATRRRHDDRETEDRGTERDIEDRHIISHVFYSHTLFLTLFAVGSFSCPVTGCRYYVPHSQAAYTGDLHYRGVSALGGGGLDWGKY